MVEDWTYGPVRNDDKKQPPAWGLMKIFLTVNMLLDS